MCILHPLYGHHAPTLYAHLRPSLWIPGPNYPGELSAIPVEKLPAAEAVLMPQTLVDQVLLQIWSTVVDQALKICFCKFCDFILSFQRLPIVDGFPVAERIQDEKVRLDITFKKSFRNTF